MRTLSAPSSHRSATGSSLPARAGLGLKSQHVYEILDTRPPLGFFEVHAENYLVDGGPAHHFLSLIRERYALSIHGVGLSIGGEAPLDLDHLHRLRALLARYEPEAFSEHLAWSSHGPTFLNDLLPLTYDDATLQRVCQHIEQTQEFLGRQLLLENPATYVQMPDSNLAEAQFVAAVIQRSGCGLLLDLNNVQVSCVNHGLDPQRYLAALPLHAVAEIHLAGYSEDRDQAGQRLLIDSHGEAIAEEVWQLYRQVLTHIGPMPTLIERDNRVPPLSELLIETAQVQHLLDQHAAPTPVPQRVQRVAS